MTAKQTRRRFLSNASMALGATLLQAPPARAEGQLETTSLRFMKSPSICLAPQDIADELLRAEGFRDIRYVPLGSMQEALAGGELDLGLEYASKYVEAIDRGLAVTVLAGAHVGLDPKDIHWVTSRSPKPSELFVTGRIDAFLGFPPEPQELRARNVRHVVVNSAVDRPWSQYFCCMLAGNSEYVRKYPVATKSVLRAILKAADLCATEPAVVARRLVDHGFTDRYDDALQMLSDLPYDKWREYVAEDTVRFYALRLYEAGMIKSSPQKIIADNTDWRFLDELKRELKA